MTARNTKLFTLTLLCLGYFIDFYDLTIMGVSYSELIQQQFQIHSTTQIQQIYLMISNFQTAGIFIGAVLFGILGDKIGRATAIKYSILLYSVATISAVFTHSLPVFITLRMLAYIGLATEFATSTVLIIELFPVKSAAWGTAFLYCFGVLGGICATLIGFISWQVMFLAGGIAGFILFLARSKISESTEFLNAQLEHQHQLGSLRLLVTNPKYLALLFRYFLMNSPYYIMITMMFIFPNYIIQHYSLSHATKLLLLGFFSGNIISSLLSAVYKQYFSNDKPFMIATLLLFIGLMLSYSLISESSLFIFSIGLGIIGGGYPILLSQQAAREFPTYIRSIASNTLFGLGRASSIMFNLLIIRWLVTPTTFVNNSHIISIIIFSVALLSILTLKVKTNSVIHNTSGSRPS